MSKKPMGPRANKNRLRAINIYCCSRQTLKTSDPVLRDLILPYLDVVDIPTNLKSRLQKSKDLRIVRRDFGQPLMSFYLFDAPDRYVRIYMGVLGDFFNWIWRDGRQQGRRRPGPPVPDPFTSEFDAACAFEDELPINYCFFRPRVSDSFLQTCGISGFHKSIDMKKVSIYTPAGSAIVDPWWAYTRLDIEARSAEQTDRCHIIKARHGLLTLEELNEAAGVIFGKRKRRYAYDWVPLPQEFGRIATDIGRAIERSSRARAGGRDGKPIRGPLYVSFDVEKMRWLNPIDAIVAFLSRLDANGEAVSAVLVNGMTAPFDGAPDDFYPLVREREEALIEELCARRPELPVVHMFGYTFAEKVEAIRVASFFISPAGSADHAPNALDVPGVLVGNPIRLGQQRPVSNERAISIPVEMVEMRDETSGVMLHEWKTRDNWKDYSLPAEQFADFAYEHYRTQVIEAATIALRHQHKKAKMTRGLS